MNDDYLDEWDELLADLDGPQRAPRAPAERAPGTLAPTDPRVPFLNFDYAYRKPPQTSRLLGRVLSAQLPRGELRIQSANLRDTLTTRPVEGALRERAASAARHGELLVLEGCFVPYGQKGREHLGFLPSALQPVIPSAELLIGERDAPHLHEADPLIARLTAQPDGVLRYLCDRAYALLGLVPVQTRRFQTCLHLLALQALSFGPPTRGENPYLSVYLSGGIGRGKSTLARMAQLWHPRAALVSAHGQTPAILAGKRAQGGADPGNLPLCTGGLLIIDNLQRLPQGKAKAPLLEILADAAAQGAVIPQGDDAAPYAAAGALILAGCRLRENGVPVKGSGVASRFEDLNLTPRLLASLDLPVIMDSDDDAAALACEMVCHEPDEDCTDEGLHEAGKRELRLLCARLRQRIPRVDTSAVEGEIAAMAADLGVIVDDLCARAAQQPTGRGAQVLPDREALRRQLPRTLRKLTTAQARLCGRDSADRADADVAFRLASLKMEVLHWLADGTECYDAPYENRLSATARARARVPAAADQDPAPPAAAPPAPPALPPLPRAVSQALQALMLRPEAERHRVALQCLPAARAPDGAPLAELRGRLQEADLDADRILDWLRGADEEQRALRCLSLFAELGPAESRDALLALWLQEGRAALRRGYQQLIDQLDREAGWPPRDWLAEDRLREDRLQRPAPPPRDLGHSAALYAP